MNFAELRQNLVSQWRQSPLLQWGSVATLVLLASYLVVFLGDLGTARARQARDLNERVIRLERFSGQTGWTSRAEAARQRRVALESRLWQAGTQGLAQANLQSWLDRELQKQGVDNYQLQVEPARPAPNRPGVLEVRARVKGPFVPEVFFNFLKVIEGHSQPLSVDQLEIQGQRFDLSLIAYFQSPGGP
jgi:hypothetical protein